MDNKRNFKEEKLNQKSVVVWFTGLSGSGKTTIACHLEKELCEKGFFTQILDGDSLRSGINKNLGFSIEDREENIRRVAEISKLFVKNGIICLNSFISPTEKIRRIAKDIIGHDDFIEIFLDAPILVCEQRDVKGLYKKAQQGQLSNFTGYDSMYERPIAPDMVIKTDELSIEASIKKCIEYLLPKITR